jgi:hypothetical protein
MLWPVGQRPDQLQPPAQVSDRFQVGRASSGQFTSPTPISDRPLPKARFREVPGQHFRLSFANIREALLDRPSDARVQLLAL